MATPWLESDNIDDYVKLYKPTCAEHAFKNHFDAFGEQNLTKIMLDYTEDSIIQVWNWSSNAAVPATAPALPRTPSLSFARNWSYCCCCCSGGIGEG